MKYRLYRLLLFKAWFDKGEALTDKIKYLVAIAGIFDIFSKEQIIIFGLCYGLFCLALGFVWYKMHIIDTENEIQNRFNPFQREVRESLPSIKRLKKQR